MKFQILFSGKNKKDISKCRLLEILPRVLRVRSIQIQQTILLCYFSPENWLSDFSFGDNLLELSCQNLFSEKK